MNLLKNVVLIGLSLTSALYCAAENTESSVRSAAATQSLSSAVNQMDLSMISWEDIDKLQSTEMSDASARERLDKLIYAKIEAQRSSPAGVSLEMIDRLRELENRGNLDARKLADELLLAKADEEIKSPSQELEMILERLTRISDRVSKEKPYLIDTLKSKKNLQAMGITQKW